MVYRAGGLALINLLAVPGVVGIDVMHDAVAASVPKGTEELNARAVDAGYESARAVLADLLEVGGR